MVKNLMTVKRIAQLFNVHEETVCLAVALRPVVREMARADGIRVFDAEGVQVISSRLKEFEPEDE